MDYNVDITTMLGLATALLVWLAGLMTSVGREIQRLGIDFKHYWVTDPLHSVSSVILSVALVIICITSKESSVFAYFSIGYMVDNFINRAVAKTGA